MFIFHQYPTILCSIYISLEMAGQLVTFNIDKEKDFARWYEDIIPLAQIVDKRTTMKGITIMPPYGCFIHTKIMEEVENAFIKQGIAKAQFPTLIPETLLK